MSAIELTQNFNEATSAYAARDLYSKKRAKLSENKRDIIDDTYSKYLDSLVVEIPKESNVNKIDEYKNVLNNHNMTVYANDINEASATGAKKLRVGEMVATGSAHFSDAIKVDRPQPVVVKEEIRVEEKPEPVVVKEEVPPVVVPDITMSRTRRHEEEMSSETYREPTITREVSEATTNQRLDSYLASGISMTTSSTDEQKLDKLAHKLSEIDALNKKASDLQAQEDELLAQEKAMDEQINNALRKADDDFFEATQSLDEVSKRVNDTEERLRRKRELISRLGKVR